MSTASDNPGTGMFPAWSSPIVLGFALCVAGAPLVPPVHIHEADARHDHATVHRHVEAHQPHGAELTDDDGRIVWLDDVGIQPAAFAVALPTASQSIAFEFLPDISWSKATSLDDAAPPHGPPRCALALRGPPCLSS